MRNKLIFLLAVVFGLATAVMVFLYIGQVKEEAAQTEFVNIVVAVKDLSADTLLKAEMVTTKKIPAQYKHPKETVNSKDVVGKILITPVTAGESIMISQVYDSKDKKEGLAYLVPVGKRAISVKVDNVSGLAGLVRPGDRVDVLATLSADNQAYTILPIQDVEVLAVNKYMDPNLNPAEKQFEISTVTLAVQYNDAKPLMMATQMGAIRLLLRSPVDHERGYYGPYKMSDLLRGTMGGSAGGQN